MKRILIILDGIVAKRLLHRIIEANTSDNYYDIIYMDSNILPVQKPSNFTFYKFDPTSISKLAMVLGKNSHAEILVSLSSKEETINVIKNIREYSKNLRITFLDMWELKFNDPHVNDYQGLEVLANGLVEKLPNIPVLAQNIGLKQGEIMEIRIPFGSSYAYRYVESIVQKDWKIFGLYRNHKLLVVDSTSILRPNDIVLIIGKPEVLMHIYNAIGKTRGQFPMPFGSNIYLYLDLYLMKESSINKIIEESLFLNSTLKNKQLIIKITRPTKTKILDLIKEKIKNNPTIKLNIDYNNQGFYKLMRHDNIKHDIGLILLSPEHFKEKNLKENILKFKIPIFKFGKEELKRVKSTIITLSDSKSYEQISPIVFDITSQLNAKTKLFNMDPLGEIKSNNNILDHFENLAKIFNEKLEIITSDSNPIRELKKQKDFLQILPLKKNMLNNNFTLKYLYTNSDYISFSMNKYNQLLIPIEEGE